MIWLIAYVKELTCSSDWLGRRRYIDDHVPAYGTINYTFNGDEIVFLNREEENCNDEEELDVDNLSLKNAIK